MKLRMILAFLLLAACAPVKYEFPDPDSRKNDFDLTYKESLPGIAVNLDGYRE
jgi:hypothetical protein